MVQELSTVLNSLGHFVLVGHVCLYVCTCTSFVRRLGGSEWRDAHVLTFSLSSSPRSPTSINASFATGALFSFFYVIVSASKLHARANLSRALPIFTRLLTSFALPIRLDFNCHNDEAFTATILRQVHHFTTTVESFLDCIDSPRALLHA